MTFPRYLVLPIVSPLTIWLWVAAQLLPFGSFDIWGAVLVPLFFLSLYLVRDGCAAYVESLGSESTAVPLMLQQYTKGYFTYYGMKYSMRPFLFQVAAQFLASALFLGSTGFLMWSLVDIGR